MSQQEPRDEAGQGAAGAQPEALPAVDFGMFVMSLASSALVQLGELSEPGDGDAESPQSNLPLAKQTIDILGMIEEKTRGNLTAEEAQLVQHLLYDLRLKYVDAKKKR